MLERNGFFKLKPENIWKTNAEASSIQHLWYMLYGIDINNNNNNNNKNTILNQLSYKTNFML